MNVLTNAIGKVISILLEYTGILINKLIRHAYYITMQIACAINKNNLNLKTVKHFNQQQKISMVNCLLKKGQYNHYQY